MSHDNEFSAIDYLRISVTDRCNLRCLYCTPHEWFSFEPHNELLTFEEIARLAKILACIGVRKIRLTGGEPLMRRGVVGLARSLRHIDGINEISLTTNGTFLTPYAEALKKSGVRRINISLDTLKREKFKRITRNHSGIEDVLRGIKSAQAAGFHPLKLNVVIMKTINDDEIPDFIDFALSEKLTLRFIEFMNITPLWDKKYFIPIEEIRRICESRFALRERADRGPGPASYYSVNGQGSVGFIHTNEKNCRRCNRLRLTSTGELKICLYEKNGICLKRFLREGFRDNEIREIIASKMCLKQGTDFRKYEPAHLDMCSIGG